MLKLETCNGNCNEIAPEHLEISTLKPKELLSNIKNAGAVFLGKFTSEALGDYCAGPNHVSQPPVLQNSHLDYQLMILLKKLMY